MTQPAVETDPTAIESDPMLWLWFSLVTGMGNGRKKQLLHGSPGMEALYRLFHKDTLPVQPLLHYRLKAARMDWSLPEWLTEAHVAALGAVETMDEANRLQAVCREKDIRILHLAGEDYPEALRDIHDPPFVLYARGNIPKARYLGVVGSRRASGYGMETATRLSQQLGMQGWCVVSGLARGIDTAAHCGALQGETGTIAVLGCGVDVAYPPENRSLMSRVEGHGAILSEYPPGTPPLSIHFPGRNRIISGISEGVLVVEAGEKSGSLITVQYALEQGREVFAIPGNITQAASFGCNRLIKEGAKLVQDVDDILDELCWGLTSWKSPTCGGDGLGRNSFGHEGIDDSDEARGLKGDSSQSRYTANGHTARGTVSARTNVGARAKRRLTGHTALNPSEESSLSALEQEALSAEEIAQRTGLGLSDVHHALLTLELKGTIVRTAQGRFMPSLR